jgi:hypothetical protein
MKEEKVLPCSIGVKYIRIGKWVLGYRIGKLQQGGVTWK